MQEALRSIICPACNGTGLGEEEKNHILQRLRMENARLKEEVIVMEIYLLQAKIRM